MVDKGFLVTPPMSERLSLTMNVRSVIGKAEWTGGMPIRAFSSPR